MEIIIYRGDAKRMTVKDTDRAAIVERWLDATTRNERLNISYELQTYETKYPHRVMLWYPDGLFAYNWKAYDNYASSAGYGIFHKYSFLPRPARTGTVEELVK
jgi:peptide/nickel transport system substrate-binding protein